MTGAHPSGAAGPMPTRRRPVSLRAFLTRLVWLCVLPLFLLAAWFGYTHIRSMQSRMDQEIADRLHNVVTAVDRIVTSQIASLQVLAASPLLDEPETREKFYREAQGFHESFGCHVILADASRRMLLNTRVPYGEPLPELPRPKGHSAVQAALEKGIPSVSNLTFGPVAREPLIVAVVPVTRGGRTPYLLMSAVPTRLFGQYLEGVALPRDWSLTLQDGNGDAIARGGPAREGERSAGAGDVRRFPKRSSVSNWSVVIDVPAAVYRAPVRNGAIALVTAILFFTLVSVLAGRLAGRRLTRAVERLAETAPAPAGSPAIAEVETVRSLLEEAGEARRQAETTLRESEERYRNLLDAAPVAIGVFIEEKVVFVNPAAVRMFGAGSPDRLIGKSIMEILPPDARERSRDRMERMLRGEEGVYPAEEVLRKIDGTALNVELMASPVVYEGKPAIQVIVSDITARKRAEEALRKSEELFRTLFQNHSAVMLLLDPDTGAILDANRAAAAFYGWPQERLRGMRIQEINTLPPERVLEEIGKVKSRKRIQFEFRHRLADGSERDVQVFSSEIEAQGRKILHSIIHDITERKKAEEALESSERRYRGLSRQFHGLLDAIPDSIMLLDRDLSILWANRATAEAVGAAPERLEGRCCHEAWHRRATPCGTCPVSRSFASGRPLAEILKGEDGRTWDVRTVPLPDASGRVESVIALKRDITEHARLEAQYLHAQKMESIGTLAGGVAHDFNNILTAIIGYGHIALMDMADDDPRRHNVASMLEAAERAAHLTKELLLFSRRQPVERRVVDLNDVVRKVEKFLRRVIGEDIECRLVYGAAGDGAGPEGLEGPSGEGRLTILADPLQLEQVLMNLATNARDAMPRGGTLSLKTSRVVLTEDFIAAHGFGKPGAYAMLSVSDTGEGMDGETLQRIFEPFFTTKDVGKGTGLGLAVAYGIVKQHEGFINAYSEPGHGTTFRIYLPLREEAASNADREPPRETPRGGTETILVAEDDGALREISKTVLTMHGYTVIEAENGEEAVRKFREHRDAVRLLLMDLIMPKMDGKEACDEIRKMRPDVKVVFSTGYAPDHLRRKLQLDGTFHLVQKPVSPAELLRKVRSVLDGE
jgi:PAS domain S-box-containing protein